MLPWQITCQGVAIFQLRRRFFRFTPRKDMSSWHPVAALTCSACRFLSRVYAGSTRKQNSKIPLTLTVWTCLNRILADPNVSWWCHGKIRQWLQSVDATYISAVVIWCRWDSFNLRWRVAAAGWTFNHPWIHNRPSLPIRKHCGLPNTRILSCGTQLKISCCWWTSWWVLHSIKWSMSSHKAETMARYRLVNRIHVMKSFPNAAQVVNSMSWFQPTEVPRPQKERKTSNGWAHLRRRQDSPHIPDTTCFLFE